MKACAIDGQLKSPEAATVSVMDHGLLYGDGVFEGLRFYNRRVFRQQEHLDRLWDSARAIGLQPPRSKDELSATLALVIANAGLDTGYIRVLLTRGEGPLGINPDTCRNPREIVIVDELTMIPAATLKRGASLIIAATRRPGGDQLDPRIKSMNYLNNILARLEANHAGADEAVMLNAQGRVAEGTADNIFIVKNGTLKTPPVSEGALDGVTRRVVLEAAHSENVPALETPLTPVDLFTADEAFLTGTGAELIPVREIAGRQLTAVRGPVFNRLETAFRLVTSHQD